ncbi:MAG: hypothetical protein LBQ28_04580 [Prevotellaceae bacterium]|jgi:hypothetical protein|nr:hypothetical protein [Prevotellaceae bacterium]
MKTKFIKYQILGCLILFVSCSHHVRLKLKSNYPPVNSDSTVVIYSKKSNDVPSQFEKLGELKVTCEKSYFVNCDSTSILSTAKNEARKAGGNAMFISLRKKHLLSFKLILDADILRISDFSSNTIEYIKPPRQSRFDSHKKGTFDLRLSLPYINFFTIKFKGEKTVNTSGFLGALIGFDYYHKDNQYLSLFVGGGMNFIVPMPAPVDYFSGEYDFVYTAYLGLTKNHVIFKKLVCGYGLSLTRNIWLQRHYYDEYDDITDILPDKDFMTHH